MLKGWHEIAMYLGITGYHSEQHLRHDLNAGGYIIRRRIGTSFKPHVCSFPSLLEIYKAEKEGRPMPTPPPDQLLVTWWEIGAGLHVCFKTAMRWQPLLERDGVLLTMHAKRGRSRIGVYCAWESQLKAFLVRYQGGKKPGYNINNMPSPALGHRGYPIGGHYIQEQEVCDGGA
jgi:hypothetical protein